jgi:hypothetical protein
MTSEIFSKTPLLKDIAIVCALNNVSNIYYSDGQFNRQGEPTEVALKVFAEKLGSYDSKFKKPEDYTKTPEAYS